MLRAIRKTKNHLSWRGMCLPAAMAALAMAAARRMVLANSRVFNLAMTGSLEQTGSLGYYREDSRMGHKSVQEFGENGPDKHGHRRQFSLAASNKHKHHHRDRHAAHEARDNRETRRGGYVSQ